MSRPRILITHWVHEDCIRLLEFHGSVTANPARESWPRAELLERVRSADALMAFMPDRVDAELLAAAPDLKIVAGAFKGCDNVDLEACTARGVWVTVVPDLLTAPTAELAVALTLALVRRVLPGDRLVRDGRFGGWRPVLYGLGLEGAAVGLVGMGALGRGIAQRLAGFGCELRYCDPRPLPGAEEERLDAERCALDELLARSDVVILAAPLTAGTRGLIGPERLAAMRPGAYLVNVGRGSVVDEDAVAAALEAGRLAGYAADVFACEDLSLPDRPREVPAELLRNAERTVLTPHLGSAVDAVRRAVARRAAESIIDCLQLRAPRGAVNRPGG